MAECVGRTAAAGHRPAADGIALNNIVQKVISTLDYDVEELVHLQRGEDGQILTLDYDTYALNQILGETLDKIDASLAAAQSGSRDPNLDEVLYEHGVIYHVALGSLTRFPFLSGIGPQVPFRFRMLNDVSGHSPIRQSLMGSTAR